MWSKELFGTDVYHLVYCFIFYSMIGWLVESIYMSICNRKITNRGFAKGPFCPIYGFGGVICYIVLHPLAGEYVKLYICGAVMATFFEFLVAKLMQRVFGEVWWDYNNKPCNYKGVVCLESTLAWGVYAIIIVKFLQNIVMRLADANDYARGTQICKVVIIIFSIDFSAQLLRALGIHFSEQKEYIQEKVHNFKARWY